MEGFYGRSEKDLRKWCRYGRSEIDMRKWCRYGKTGKIRGSVLLKH